MIEIGIMSEYDPDVAEQMGTLLTQLSTKWDGSAVSREWIEDVIESPHHDQILAFDEDGKLIGMATTSVVLGAKIGRNAYLEDYVVDENCRGQGIGTQLWDKIIAWGRHKGCNRLEFTASGKDKKTGAVSFYLKKNASIYDTNFFRVELSDYQADEKPQ
ncbi:MAG: GNAT family N-acetyltransferase [Candidatus Nomurabacteria bacterium]|jgi:GNAT superfamily N-acetyltransferase|nr:GNAT family N-acetyltransferase [Candidatus Nomurabacteria bacterium]